MTGGRTRRAAAGWVLSLPVRIYQLVPRSPVPRCRFAPTCSSYAVEALRTHGAVRGGWLALRRIGRCHPFHPGGIDRVPPVRARRGAAAESGDLAEVVSAAGGGA